MNQGFCEDDDMLELIPSLKFPLQISLILFSFPKLSKYSIKNVSKFFRTQIGTYMINMLRKYQDNS